MIHNCVTVLIQMQREEALEIIRRVKHFDDDVDLNTSAPLAFFSQFDVDGFKEKMALRKKKYVRCTDPDPATRHQIVKELEDYVKPILSKNDAPDRKCFWCGEVFSLGGVHHYCPAALNSQPKCPHPKHDQVKKIFDFQTRNVSLAPQVVTPQVQPTPPQVEVEQTVNTEVPREPSIFLLDSADKIKTDPNQKIQRVSFPDHKVKNVEVLINYLTKAKEVTLDHFVAILASLGIKGRLDMMYIVSFVVIRDGLVCYLPHWEREKRESEITSPREDAENMWSLIWLVNEVLPRGEQNDDDFFE